MDTCSYKYYCTKCRMSGKMDLLTVVVLGGEKPDERGDALPVLRVVQVVAPAIQGAVSGIKRKRHGKNESQEWLNSKTLCAHSH